MNNRTDQFANLTSSSSYSASVVPETPDPCAANATTQRSRSPSPRTVGHFRLFVEKFKRNTAGSDLPDDNDMMYKLQYMLDQFGSDNRLIRPNRDPAEQRLLDEAKRRRTERKAQVLKNIEELKRAIALRDEKNNNLENALKSILKPASLLVPSPQQALQPLILSNFSSPTSVSGSFRHLLPSLHPSSFELSNTELPGPSVANKDTAKAAQLVEEIVHHHSSSSSLCGSQQQQSASATIHQRRTSTTTSGDGKRFSHVQTIQTTVTNQIMSPITAVQHQQPSTGVQRKKATNISNASIKPPQRHNRRVLARQQQQQQQASIARMDGSQQVAAVAVAAIPDAETSSTNFHQRDASPTESSTTYDAQSVDNRQRRAIHAFNLRQKMIKEFKWN